MLKGYGVTTGLGRPWQQYAQLPDVDMVLNLPKVSNPPSPPHVVWNRPSIFTAIRSKANIASGINVWGLARITKKLIGLAADVTYPAMNGFGSFGLFPTMFPTYVVFGVDPNDPRHIMAPDVLGKKMMESRDGGENWSEIPKLTSMVTEGGRIPSSASRTWKHQSFPS